jgi:hypothetical protein
MLSDSKLPVLFWGEAVNTACYVLNRVLTVKRFNKTCYELMFNKKPNLKGFEPFGLPCTIVRNKDKQKFGEVADEGYFLGYVPGTPNKRVFNLKSGKIEVVFNVEITSYKPQQSTSSNAILYDYDSVFKSFNIPEFSNADDSQLIQTVISEDDEGEFMPRSSVSMTDAPETSSSAAAYDSSDSGSEPIQGEDFTNPFANVQGEVGSNLGDNLEVDTIATTRANRDHPVDTILGDPTAGVQTRRTIAESTACMLRLRRLGL